MNDSQILQKIAELKQKLSDDEISVSTQSIIHTDIRYYENILQIPLVYREEIKPKADIIDLLQKEEKYTEYYQARL